MKNKLISDKNLFSYLVVVDKNSHESIGYVGGLSTHEIILVADESIPLKKVKDIVITLPHHQNFPKRLIELQINTSWSRPDSALPHLHFIGCEILMANPDDIDILIDFPTPQNFPVVNKRSPRKNLLFYLDVIDRKTQELLGHIGDISKEGIMIITNKPIPLDHVKDISIKLPDLEEFPKKSIEARIETRWTKSDINPSLYCIGCRFLQIDSGDLQLIEQVEDILGFSD